MITNMDFEKSDLPLTGDLLVSNLVTIFMNLENWSVSIEISDVFERVWYKSLFSQLTAFGIGDRIYQFNG